MNACTFGNVNTLQYLVANSRTVGHNLQDHYGFTALTYAIKNNFFVGFVYLLACGATLDPRVVDVNKCTYLHWATFMDRISILGVLFRADFDFLKHDKSGKTPWDRAMDNWSLFCLHFMLDYSQRPLKTLYFLKGSTNFPIIDMLPPKPQKRSYEVESHHIPAKMLRQRRLREGVHKSLASVLSHSWGYLLPEFVSVNWYRHNITSKYWLKTYLFVVAILAAVFAWTVQSCEQPVSTAYLVTVAVLLAFTLWKMVRFGTRQDY